MKPWPELEYKVWKDTYQTLHRWMQIVGKLRVAMTEPMNHSWNSVLYVTPTGLTTSPMPAGDGSLSVDFDFSEHSVHILSSEGRKLSLHLQSELVADFYRRLIEALQFLGVKVSIDVHPNELPDALPFPDDCVHRTYRPEQVEALWHVLVLCDLVLKKFRAQFSGKASPVHFFWGSFDLAATRFSGRRAPEHPGGVPHLSDLVTREAYSHEVSSCGFWPGNDLYPHAAFYSYAYPEPEGFKDFPLHADEAFYHEGLREFILPYDLVRTQADPESLLLTFFGDTFTAASRLGNWNAEVFAPSEYLEKMRHDREFFAGK
jgi:hypothetical protein